MKNILEKTVFFAGCFVALTLSSQLFAQDFKLGTSVCESDFATYASSISDAGFNSLYVKSGLDSAKDKFYILNANGVQTADVNTLKVKDSEIVAVNLQNNINGKSPEDLLKSMEAVSKHIKEKAGDKAGVIFTGLTFPNSSTIFGHSRPESSDYIVRSLFLSRTMPNVKGAFCGAFKDKGTDRFDSEVNCGFLDSKGFPKQSYFAIKSIADILTKAKFVGRVKTENPDLWILKFKLGEEDVFVMWSADLNMQYQAIFKASKNNPKKPFKAYLAGRDSVTMEWGFREFFSARGKINRTYIGDKVSFTVWRTPFIVRGDFSNTDLEVDIPIKFETSRMHSLPKFSEPSTKAAIISKDYGVPIELEKCGDYLTSDLSGTFVGAYDKDVFKLKIELKDNKFIASEKGASDKIRLYFKVFGLKETIYPYTELEIRPVSDTKTQVKFLKKQSEAISENVSVSMFTTIDKKVVYEIKIPVSVLGLLAYEKDFRVKSAITCSDCDSLNGEEVDKLTWGESKKGVVSEPIKFNYILFK